MELAVTNLASGSRSVEWAITNLASGSVVVEGRRDQFREPN